MPYYFFKFYWFPRKFLDNVSTTDAISGIFGLSEILFSYRNTTRSYRRGSFSKEGFPPFEKVLHKHRVVRAPGNRLPLKRKLRCIRASGISVLNQFLSLRSSFTTARRRPGTSSVWTSLRWENRVLPTYEHEVSS